MKKIKFNKYFQSIRFLYLYIFTCVSEQSLKKMKFTESQLNQATLVNISISVQSFFVSTYFSPEPYAINYGRLNIKIKNNFNN